MSFKIDIIDDLIQVDLNTGFTSHCIPDLLESLLQLDLSLANTFDKLIIFKEPNIDLSYNSLFYENLKFRDYLENKTFKIGFVADTDFNYGTARVWQSTLGLPENQSQIFKKNEDAVAWLRND